MGLPIQNLTYLLIYIFIYLLTYLLTPRRRVLLENLTGWQLVKYSYVFWSMTTTWGYQYKISLTYLVIYLLTYLLTHSLTPRSRVLLEKLTGLQLVKKFPAFYGTRRYITPFTSARHLSLSRASSIQSISPHPTF